MHENRDVAFVEGISRPPAKFHIAAMFKHEVLGFSDSQTFSQNFPRGRGNKMYPSGIGERVKAVHHGNGSLKCFTSSEI